MKWMGSFLLLLVLTIGVVGYFSWGSHSAAETRETLERSYRKFEEVGDKLLDGSQKLDKKINEAKSQAEGNSENSQAWEDGCESQYTLLDSGVKSVVAGLQDIQKHFFDHYWAMHEIAGNIPDPAVRKAEFDLNERMISAFHGEVQETIQKIRWLYSKRDEAFVGLQRVRLARARNVAFTDVDALGNINNDTQRIAAGLRSIAQDGLKMARESQARIEVLVGENAS